MQFYWSLRPSPLPLSTSMATISPYCIHPEGTEEDYRAFRLPATGDSPSGLRLATCTTLILSITIGEEGEPMPMNNPPPSGSQHQGKLPGPTGP